MEPFKKPEGISWDAATVELPEMPMVQPGEDAMSATIAAVLPTLSAPFTANVAALQAKEGMFSGKLVTAQAAYTNADEQGGQGVGQFTDMLGQLGKMGSEAAGSMSKGGQGGGMFGSMMQQAMQAAQQFGGKGGGVGPTAAGQGGQGGQGGPAAGAPAGAAASQAPQTPPSPQEREAEEPRGREQDRDEKNRDDERRPLLDRAEVAGPEEGAKGAGPAPVAPPQPSPQPSTDAEIEDLARRML